MNTRWICTLALLVVANMAYSQAGYKIEVNTKGLSDTTIYLANYIGDKLYYADTAQVNTDGYAVFEGKKALEQGKYSVVYPNYNFVQILVDDQHFSIETDTTHYYNNAIAKNSPTNSKFFDHFRFLIETNQQKSPLLKERNAEGTTEARKKELEAEIKVLDDAVKAHLVKEHEDNEDNLYGTVIGLKRPIDVPDAPTDANGNVLDSLWQYKYYRGHFLDYVNFKDPRIMRTPEYHAKLDEFTNKVLPQHPDSMVKYLDPVMEQVSYNEPLKSYTARYLAANFKRSKYMGMEGGFVHIVENYFDMNMSGVDSTRLADAIEEAQDMKPTLMGKKAPDVRLHNADKSKFYNLYDIDADFTLVYIWSPSCGHCTEENPKLVTFAKEYAAKGVKPFVICNDAESEEWVQYLKDNPEFAKLLNLSDSPGNRSNFRKLYNSRTTPTIVLLDKDKKVIGKRLGIDQLGGFIDNYIKEN